MHVPAMAEEALELLQVRSDGIYLDATTGLGGHTARIAERLTTGVVIAADRDPLSLEIAKRNLAAWAGRIRFRHGPFSSLTDTVGGDLGKAPVQQTLDGILADLGVSRYQLTY